MVDGKDYTVEIYETIDGVVPYSLWLKTLTDTAALVKIDVRIARMRKGLFGDVKPVGEGVHEIRVFVGKGYRVYFSTVGQQVILLLAGGDKQSKKQQQRDIHHAREYLDDYKKRNR